MSSLAFAFSSGELTEQEAVAKPDMKWYVDKRNALAFQLNGSIRDSNENQHKEKENHIERGTYKAGRDDFGAHSAFGQRGDGWVGGVSTTHYDLWTTSSQLQQQHPLSRALLSSLH